MKFVSNTFKIILTLFISLYSITLIAQPAGSPVYYEGEIYNTIIIGTQCWMTENLNVGKIISGTAMPSNDGFIEKICYDDNPVNCETYGGLYRWNELMDYETVQGSQGICPTGWHIPKDFEWTTLVNGFSSDPDSQLVVGGSSGFDAMFGGYANTTGGFYQLGYVGAYFSSTKISFQAYRRSFDGTGQVSRALAGLSDGYSVRCMRNSLTAVIPFDISISGIDALCTGTATGSVSLLVSGTSNPTFLWSNGSTVEDLIDVPAGTYSVTVTEGTQTLTESYTISEPAILVASASINTGISCYNGSNGILTVNSSGGIGPYSYLWSNGINSSTASGFSEGTHFITVTDANGCEVVDDIYLENPIQQVFYTANVSNLNCFDDNSGIIDITPQGTGSFLYNWSNYQVSQDLNNLSAGSYTVTITHNGFCSVGSWDLTEPDLLMLSYQAVNPTDQGLSDGSIDLTVTGGTMPYVYSWTNGATTQDLNFVPAGSYFASVTDVNQCSEISGQIILSEPGINVTNTIINDISCNGASDGTIYIVASSNGTITYDIGFGLTNFFGYFGGLSAGVYSVTMTDNLGGSLVLSNLVVNEPDPILFSLSQIGGCSGTNVTIMASGGTPPLTYSKNGSTYQSSNLFENTAPGTYTFYVKDDEDCMNTQSYTVNSYNSLSVSESIINPLCSGASNGSIQLSVSNGVPPITYTWSNGSNSFYNTGLAAGNYWVTVTSNNGCILTEFYSLTNPQNIVINLSGNDISSPGGSDGSISTNVTGGTPPFSFSWSNGLSSQNISGLTAGQYIVTLTDANQCNAYSSIILEENSVIIDIAFSLSGITCNGGNNGLIQAIPTGGVSPYTYLWSNGQTNAYSSGLIAGGYSVTVTDNDGNLANNSTYLSNPDAISIILQSDSTYNTYDVSCFTCNDGHVSAYANGGNSPYTYLWSNGETTSFNSGLSQGTYTVTVTDSEGCFNTASIFLTSPDELLVSINTSDYNGYGVSCPGEMDGNLFAIVSGSIGPFTYNWSSGQQTNSVNNVLSGNYTVTVTANNGEITVASITLTEPTLMDIFSVIQDVSILGNNDGSIYISVQGGVPGYSYLWNNGTTQNNLTGLSVGDYFVTVTDANSCVLSETFNISTLPLEVLVNESDVSCNGGSDGNIDANPSGGGGSFTYLWSTGATTNQISNLMSGEYFVTVYDFYNDSVVESVNLTEPDVIEVSLTGNSITYSGGNDGSLLSSVTGGSSPYTYLWSNGATTQNISGLSTALYVVTVTDINQCYSVASDSLIEFYVDFDIYNITCFGGNNGSIVVLPSGGSPPYSYLWSEGQTNDSIFNLNAGEYFVTVSDSSGNSSISSSTVTNPQQIFVSTQVNSDYNNFDVSCFTCSDGEATVYATLGLSPYTYLWSNGITSDNNTNLSRGMNYVTVTDSNGCSNIDSVNLNSPDSFSITISITSDFNGYGISCFGASDGSLHADLNGGLGYAGGNWSTGAVQANINSLSAGIYSVSAIDNNGAMAYDTIYIGQPDSIIIIPDITDASNSLSSDGAINLQMSGGVTPFLFDWSNSETSGNISNLSIGVYSVTATDVNSCLASMSMEVSNLPLASILLVNDVLCFGDSNGSAIVTPNGGSLPYSYNWSTGSTISEVFNLQAGQYNVTVYDMLNDSVVENVVVGTPDQLYTNLIGNDISIPGGNDGSIELSVSGGSGNNSYLWSNSATSQNLENLSLGTYYVTVTDSNGCLANDSISLLEIEPGLSVILTTTDIECNGFDNGIIELTVSGGELPYTYLWSNGDTLDIVSALSPGNYAVTVYDFLNDSVVGSTIVTEPSEIDMSFSVQDVTCYGESDGIAEVTVTGGLPPYSYLWTDGAITSETSNLIAGNYTVYVSDDNNCYSLLTIEIDQPNAFDVSAIVNNTTGIGNSDGAAELSVTGNSAPYTYLWSTGATTNNVNNLSSGVFNVHILDTNFCNLWYFVEVFDDVYGCMDPLALNYNPNANIDDGSCTYNTGTMQIIQLDSEWSLFSTYIFPTAPNIADVLVNVVSDVIIVKDGDGQIYWPLVGLNQIGNLSIGEGYQIKMAFARTLTINGAAVSPELITLVLPENWSILGYLRNTPAPIITILSPIVANIDIVKNDQGSVYWPFVGLDQILTMTPGKGYQINMNSSGLLTYPSNAIVYPESSNKSTQNSNVPSINTGSNMTIGIPLNSWDNRPQFGDIVIVKNSLGDIVGSMVFNDENIAIAVWGDDELTLNIDGMKSDEELNFFILKENGQLNQMDINHWIKGDNRYKTDGTSIVGSVSIDDNLDMFELFQNSPNPFQISTEISFNLSENSEVSVKIYNLTGVLVKDLGINEYQKGFNIIEFNGSDLPSGTYMYRVIAGENISTKLMSIVR